MIVFSLIPLMLPLVLETRPGREERFTDFTRCQRGQITWVLKTACRLRDWEQRKLHLTPSQRGQLVMRPRLRVAHCRRDVQLLSLLSCGGKSHLWESKELCQLWLLWSDLGVEHPCALGSLGFCSLSTTSALYPFSSLSLCRLSPVWPSTLAHGSCSPVSRSDHHEPSALSLRSPPALPTA